MKIFDEKYFGKNDSSMISIIKLVVFLLLFLLIFYIISLGNPWLPLIPFILLLILLSKKGSSKKDFNMIWHSSINLYMLIWYAIIYFGAFLLFSGLMFAYSDPDIVKYLLILSFTLAGITFIAIMQKQEEISEINKKVWKYGVMSSLFFSTAGFAFLLELGSFLIKNINPLTGKPFPAYDWLTHISPFLGVIGAFTLTLGLYLMILSILARVKEILHSREKQKGIREELKDFFGLSDNQNIK